ncbi:MAG: toll/interleukin-1 receptor domain-containing protein [Cyanobacteria bacterium P01_D01_bin.128]
MSELNSDDYEYDIFLSYTRNLVGDWVQSYFYELFEEHLGAALGRKPSIFIDTKSISAGEDWPLGLQEALARSRCMVAAISPAYFRSVWCMKECHTMLEREKAEGYRTENNTRGLFIPIVARNGEHHPQYIRHIQSINFKRYVRKGGAFPNSPRYIEFEDEIERWTKQVADAVTHAPAWKSTWLDNQNVEIPKIEAVQFMTKPRIR